MQAIASILGKEIKSLNHSGRFDSMSTIRAIRHVCQFQAISQAKLERRGERREAGEGGEGREGGCTRDQL